MNVAKKPAAPVAMGARCCLKAMLQPVDGESAKVTIEEFEVVQNTTPAGARKRSQVRHDDVLVLLRAFAHVMECCACAFGHLDFSSSSE